MLFLTREQRIVVALAVTALLVFSGGLLFQRVRTASRANEPLFVESPLAATAKPDSLLVHVAGCVKRPGVYRLNFGSRVQDALAAAGGVGEQGDPHQLNLAAYLNDGEKIEVPSRNHEGAATAPALPERSPVSASGKTARVVPGPDTPSKPSPEWLARHKVNLNRAGLSQLAMLPGIGPGLAQRILDYRKQRGRFSSVEDLKNVSGIGAKRFSALKDLVTI